MAIEENSLSVEEAAKQKEAERAEELKSLQAKAREEELKRVRAEGELEAARKFAQTQPAPQAPQQAQWTEEQWEAEAQKYGMTGPQLKLTIGVADTIAAAKLKGVEDKVKQAEERAAQAERRASEFESKRGFESSVREFYEKNPQYASFKKDINDFLSDFSDADKNDPDKRSRLFERAKVYAKGVAGGKMRNVNAGNSGSARIGGEGEAEGEGQEPERIDFTGLDERPQRRLIEDIHEENKSRDSDKELAELLKTSQSSDGKGVRYDSSSEFKQGEEFYRRGGRLGGKRGE